MIRAAIILSRGNGSNEIVKAIEALATATRYESAFPGSLNVNLYPAFLRAEAYLMAHQATPAAAEFQKILDHPGVVLNEPIGALAHLGLGRARTLAGDMAAARSAYQDFLALWKDADPDVPVLRQAKAEYAKLRAQR